MVWYRVTASQYMNVIPDTFCAELLDTFVASHMICIVCSEMNPTQLFVDNSLVVCATRYELRPSAWHS
jgi:hypothetical protein